jgi:hypothetical protein
VTAPEVEEWETEPPLVWEMLVQPVRKAAANIKENKYVFTYYITPIKANK